MTSTASRVPRQRGRNPGPGTTHGSSLSDLSVDERVSLGKDLRASVPLASHADLAAGARRPDPIAVLEAQSAQRLPELVPVRYARMSESPFRFYRGAAALMAQDLAPTPTTGLRAQLCGDAHMLNFRLLASPERHLIFDINDFDETLPGPWEWDVKRLAASLVIAGRANGFSENKRREIVTAGVRAYREWMGHFARQATIDVWRAQASMELIQEAFHAQMPKRGRKQLAATMATARRRNNAQAVRKLTVRQGSSRQIVADPPLLVPVNQLEPGRSRDEITAGLKTLIRYYARTLPSDRRHLIEQYRIVDLARKVVGVGSVGTRCWIVLLLGRDADDALLLQVKEANESVLAPFCGVSAFANQGQRVVVGQRLMQASSDIFLGWQRTTDPDGSTREYYVRQLRDWKGIAVPEQMRPHDMSWFALLAGATLARAHAKSGDRIAIASYLGKSVAFDTALAGFAEAYANQNERDYALLLEGIASGRLPTNRALKAKLVSTGRLFVGEH